MIFPKNIEDYKYDCVIDGKITQIQLSEIKTKYVVIIFYPLDFTFVCPTEIRKFSEMHQTFKELNTTILFCSCDSVYSHLEWSKKSKDQNGLGGVEWPMISDIKHQLCSQFGLFNEDNGAVRRATVIMKNNFEVLHISVNIDPIGRSTKEILRLIKAIDFYEKNGDICPIDFEN